MRSQSNFKHLKSTTQYIQNENLTPTFPCIKRTFKDFKSEKKSLLKKCNESL